MLLVREAAWQEGNTMVGDESSQGRRENLLTLVNLSPRAELHPTSAGSSTAVAIVSCAVYAITVVVVSSCISRVGENAGCLGQRLTEKGKRTIESLSCRSSSLRFALVLSFLASSARLTESVSFLSLSCNLCSISCLFFAYSPQPFQTPNVQRPNIRPTGRPARARVPTHSDEMARSWKERERID